MGVQKLKVMIIDDNARFRALVKTIVTQPEDDVLELDDGIHVNEHYATFHPDWVLMDVQMKQVDGLQATHKLVKEFPSARVVILSNHTNKRMVAKGLQLGAQAYLSKEDIFAVHKLIRLKPLDTEGYNATLIH